MYRSNLFVRNIQRCAELRYDVRMIPLERYAFSEFENRSHNVVVEGSISRSQQGMEVIFSYYYPITVNSIQTRNDSSSQIAVRGAFQGVALFPISSYAIGNRHNSQPQVGAH